jgi:hypothetical protein
MRWLIVIVAIALLGGWQPAAAQALGEITLKPVDWPEESTYEYAIFDRGTGDRIATAYYRIISETVDGEKVWRIKYVGRNEDISESAECYISRGSLTPIRSTRKIVTEGRTYYQDNSYGDGIIIIRSKNEGGKVFEHSIPAPGVVYDYEQLMWMVPYIDFGAEDSVYFNVFISNDRSMTISTAVVDDLGVEELTVINTPYYAHHYRFELSMIPSEMWTVEQDGRPVIARFDTGTYSFVNLQLDPGKAGQRPQR